jgi:hypothetical protein
MKTFASLQDCALRAQGFFDFEAKIAPELR